MDNASIHSNEEVDRALNRVHPKYHLHKLPPYSPRLNIIEQVFNEWKCEARVAQFKCAEDVFDAIHRGAQRITITHLQGYYRHMEEKVFPDCLAQRPMQ